MRAKMKQIEAFFPLVFLFRVLNPSRLKGFPSSFFFPLLCAHVSALNAHVTRDVTRVLYIKRDNTRGTFYLLSVESIRET